MAKLFANSGDPDQMPHFVASDLGLHCLPVTLLGVPRLKWFKDTTFACKMHHVERCFWAYENSEGTDQPANLHSVTRALTVSLQTYWVLVEYKRPLSYYMAFLAELNLYYLTANHNNCCLLCLLLVILKAVYANNVDQIQTAPLGAV